MSAVFDLTGRTALITGSVRGIGFALAEGLCNAGATAIVNGRKQDAVDEAVAKLRAKGFQARGAVFDVAEELAVVAAFENFDRDGVEIDILINNAGITRDNLLMRMKDDEWNEIIDTNLTSLYRLSKPVLRAMMKKRNGRIISIGSVVGTMGNAGQVNYAAAKAGLVGFTKSLAREVASRGITVNAVAPGFIETDMTKALNEEQRAGIMNQVPAARLGDPKEIAAAVVFLASDDAAYITGETLHVNGGMYMV